MLKKLLLLLFLCLSIYIAILQPAFAGSESRADSNSSYTLYRSSATTNGRDMRIHVATFDAAAGITYNRDNCEIAEKLFQAQPGVTVVYWCERGYYSEK